MVASQSHISVQSSESAFRKTWHKHFPVINTGKRLEVSPVAACSIDGNTYFLNITVTEPERRSKIIILWHIRCSVYIQVSADQGEDYCYLSEVDELPLITSLGLLLDFDIDHLQLMMNCSIILSYNN